VTSRQILKDHLPALREFLDEVSAIDDEEERQDKLRRIRPLIRLLRSFYAAFLQEVLDVRISSFSYRDKRRVSRRLVRAEDAVADVADDAPARLSVDLAAQFEDLADLLHGELEFGYSDSTGDYRAFHREAFPRWLDGAANWLEAEGDDPELAEDMNKLFDKYWDVIVRSY
jgi:hypothetical protein